MNDLLALLGLRKLIKIYFHYFGNWKKMKKRDFYRKLQLPCELLKSKMFEGFVNIWNQFCGNFQEVLEKLSEVIY